MSAIPKRKPKHHALKIWPEFFEAILNQGKRFEVRKDDRDFQVGDTVTLHEYIPGYDYTGRNLHITITYILVGQGLQDGYCCFSFEPEVGEIYRHRYPNDPRKLGKLEYKK